MATGGITLREATTSDYKAIVDINSDVYEGYDYLPIMFYEMFHHKQLYMYVGELDGKVVGFFAYKILNEGKTGLSMAARTAQSVQRTGFTAKIKALSLTKLKEDSPEIVETISAIPIGPFYNFWQKQLSNADLKANCLVHRFYFLAYKLDASKIQSICAELQTPDTMACNASLLGTTASEADMLGIKSILAEEAEYFMYDYWLVRKVTLANIKHLLRTSYVVVTRDKAGEIIGFSNFSSMPSKHGLRIDIWVHGKQSIFALRHLQVAFMELNRKSSHRKSRVDLILCHPEHFGEVMIENALLSTLGSRKNTRTFTSKTAVLWRDRI